ncbi:cation diffusion facilitator family transporter [Kribbella sp. NPDC054772]
MSGHGHGHPTATGEHRRALIGALIASLAILVVEVVGAMVSGSLALLADAGHVVADSSGVALALAAATLAARPPSGRRTFGWARAEILAAAANGLILTGMGLYVLVQGVRRLVEPGQVEAGSMGMFALVGLLGNLVALALLFRARGASLNLRGAFLEVATDTAASVGVLIAAIVIATTGFVRADALVSVAIGLLILPRAVRLLRDAVHILLEAAPGDIDLDELRRNIETVEHVTEVHDLHVTTVTSGQPVLSAHVVVEETCFQDGYAPRLLDQLQARVRKDFDVEHATFQLEPSGHVRHEQPQHA